MSTNKVVPIEIQDEIITGNYFIGVSNLHLISRLQYICSIITSIGRNHVHLTEWFGFVNRHLWLGNFGKRNRGLRARSVRLRFPSAN